LSKSKIRLEREFKRKQEFKNKKLRQKQTKELSPLDTLNEEQLKAVYSKHKHNLIIASAGTGKTSTIIGRVVRLLQEGIKPDEIILLTFTSKAGTEMLERLEKHFSSDVVSKIFAGTFHSYGKMLMDKAGIPLKLKKQKDLTSLIASLMEKNIFKQNTENPYSASAINGYIGLYENTRDNETFSEWLLVKFQEKYESSKTEASAERVEAQIEAIEMYEWLYQEYVNEKKSHKFCDFNDLLKYIGIYYNKNPNRIKQIIVDEYQDTNTLQNKVLKKMADIGSRIFAVGDYDQSIYGFNGSDVEVVREFPKRYQDTGIFNLSKNYRSSKQILGLANNCIENNDRIIPKRLVAMKSGVFPEPTLKVFETIREQYRGVAEMIDSSSYDNNDIAILFRSNNSGNLMEAILIEMGIPTVRVKSGSFFDGVDIATMVSVYKIITDSATVLDFINLYNYIGADKNTCKEMFDAVQKSNNKASAIKEYVKPTLYSSDARVKDFIQLLQETDGVTSPFTIFRLIIDNPCYQVLFNSTFEMAKKFNKNTDDSLIIEQIEQKHELLLKIAQSCDTPREFNMKLNFSSKEEDNEYGVKLLTVHASKGLEFKSVYVIDLSEERFPNLKLAEGGAGIDEERRLFYVALTRAEEHLVLTSYKIDDTKKKPKAIEISRFVKESGIIRTYRTSF